jgi:hypothetical protein
MSTIITLEGDNLKRVSRVDINSNFAALNTEKIETSYLDTDTTLAANSDTKIATQKAVKSYVDAGGSSWVDYSATSTVVGFSGTPTKVIKYLAVGKTVYVQFYITGTSNATGFSFTLPSSAANNGLYVKNVLDAVDNGSAVTAPGLISLDPSNNLVTLYSTWASGAWTNSGTKSAKGQFFFEKV